MGRPRAAPAHAAARPHERNGPHLLRSALVAGVLSAMGADPSIVPGSFRQRPASVSQTGRSCGQQCCWSSQHTALGSGQQAHVKQYLRAVPRVRT